MSELERARGDGPIPPNVHDRVVLYPERRGVNRIVHGWIGEWPPPANLVRVVDKRVTFKIDARLVDPARQEPGTLEQFWAHPSFDVQEYRLINIGTAPKGRRVAEYIQARRPSD